MTTKTALSHMDEAIKLMELALSDLTPKVVEESKKAAMIFNHLNGKIEYLDFIPEQDPTLKVDLVDLKDRYRTILDLSSKINTRLRLLKQSDAVLDSIKDAIPKF